MAFLLLLVILTISYRQTVEAYPNGGGAYVVAKNNLKTVYGLIAGADRGRAVLVPEAGTGEDNGGRLQQAEGRAAAAEVENYTDTEKRRGPGKRPVTRPTWTNPVSVPTVV
ncbi:MAG: hypothetical protein HPY50_21815 [Firmicutes bacterium]|nr:hypothetical protein [Bacillota bacterium]